METPHLYINQYEKTQSYLRYLIDIYVFQIKSSLASVPLNLYIVIYILTNA